MTIEELLANYRENAAILEHACAKEQAELYRRVAQEVTDALGDYLRWLSEEEAALWSGKSTRWLRDRFEAMAATMPPTARRAGRHRQYRAAALPRAVDYIGLRAQARQDAAA